MHQSPCRDLAARASAGKREWMERGLRRREPDRLTARPRPCSERRSRGRHEMAALSGFRKRLDALGRKPPEQDFSMLRKLLFLERQHGSERCSPKAEGRTGVDLNGPDAHCIERAEKTRDCEAPQRQVRHAIERRRHDGAMPHASRHNPFPKRPITRTKPASGLIGQWRVETYDQRRVARQVLDQGIDLGITRYRKGLDELCRVLAATQDDDTGLAGTGRSGQVNACREDRRHGRAAPCVVMLMQVAPAAFRRTSGLATSLAQVSGA